jgi:diaminopropionate ammonia-lyase family
MATTYTNPNAHSWQAHPQADLKQVQIFHHGLPGFTPTPLVPLSELASDLGVRGVFVKDESSRLGLPAFKILGASWGTYRAVTAVTGIAADASLAEVATAAQKHQLTLFAATDGNHGRAVAYMAKLLGIQAEIFVPNFTDEHVQKNIRSEGARVTVVDGDYDKTCFKASQGAKAMPGGLQIQDNAFEDYEEIPRHIVEGYSTLLLETEQQLRALGLSATTIVTPIGVGSLGHAVTLYCKSSNRGIRVLAVEPETSACLNDNLRAGQLRTISTSSTIMDGMNCGTVSPTSWPILKKGIDASVTITDLQSHQAVQYLQTHKVRAGPCGAGALAGFLKVARSQPGAIGLDENSVVVLLSTEGTRFYIEPRQ